MAATTTSSASTLRRLSPTALDRYRTCPKQFWFLHVAGQRPEDRPSPVLSQANALHHALERFYGLPDDDRQPKNLERALRSVWPHHRTTRTFVSRDEESAYGTAAIEMLRDYAGRSDLAIRPLAREQWLSYELPNRIELYGKLDRVDDAAGMVDVIDYKTGRRVLDDDELKHDLAAQVYALAAARAYDRPVRAVRFIYLATGTQTSWYPEADDLRDVEDRLVSLTNEIRATTQWSIDTPRPSVGALSFLPARLRRSASVRRLSRRGGNSQQVSRFPGRRTKTVRNAGNPCLSNYQQVSWTDPG
jgi:putative RecB family exonuclease